MNRHLDVTATHQRGWQPLEQPVEMSMPTGRAVWRGRTYDLTNPVDVVELTEDLEFDDVCADALDDLTKSDVTLAYEAGEPVTARQVLDMATPVADPAAERPLTPADCRLRRGPEMDHFRANYGR